MPSNSIKTIIIDDEPAAIDSLKIKLEIFCQQVEIVAVCKSAKEGLQAINDHNPNLVFLDIEMPWMNGFEMLNCLGDDINFDVVFVTAYDQHAIQAFKVQAQDYLLKPVDKDDLIECINRINKNSLQFNQEKLSGILTELDQPATLKHILLHTKNAIEVIAQDEIIYLKADSNYCHIHAQNEKRIMVTKTLNDLEKLLDPSQFIRIHRSYTVNINCIEKITTEIGNHEVQIQNDIKLPLSRRKKDSLLTLLGQIKK